MHFAFSRARVLSRRVEKPDIEFRKKPSSKKKNQTKNRDLMFEACGGTRIETGFSLFLFGGFGGLNKIYCTDTSLERVSLVFNFNQWAEKRVGGGGFVEKRQSL